MNLYELDDDTYIILEKIVSFGVRGCISRGSYILHIDTDCFKREIYYVSYDQAKSELQRLKKAIENNG